MKLTDVDFEYSNGFYSQKLSEVSEDEIEEINRIAQAILDHKIFDCETKAVLAAFQIFLEAQAETNEWISEGGKHH